MVCMENPTVTENHPNVAVPNLYVWLLLKSLTSKELVKKTFAWRHAYCSLTDAGIEYMRQYMGIPSDVVPKTLKVPAKAARPAGGERRGPPRGGDRDDRRGGYRGEGGDKRSGDFNPEFVSSAINFCL